MRCAEYLTQLRTAPYAQGINSRVVCDTAGKQPSIEGQERNPNMAVLDLFRLDGGAAFITGGSRGIGLGIALALAEAGCDIALMARQRASLDDAVAQIEARGRKALAIVGD